MSESVKLPRFQISELFWIPAGMILLGAASWVIITVFDAPAQNDEQVVRERVERLENYRAQVREEYSSYGWVDADQGIVRIPVELAAEQIVPVLQARPVQPSETPWEPPLTLTPPLQ